MQILDHRTHLEVEPLSKHLVRPVLWPLLLIGQPTVQHRREQVWPEVVQNLDLYDIVIGGRRDPEQLERAVNMLSPETQEEAAFIWHTRRGNIERDAIDTLMPLSSDEPLEVPPSQLVDAAIRMVEKSRYETIDLEPATPGRSARIVMVTASGESRRIVVPRAEIAEVLEGTGMNHCLTARYIDIDSFVEALHTEREYPAARESPA